MSNSSFAMVPPDINSIMGVIDTHVRWKYNTKGNRNYEVYHPSAFGDCLRKMQYQRYVDRGYLTVEGETLNSQKLRLFDKGHNMHERWASYAADIGILRGYWYCIETKETIGLDDPLGSFRPKDEKHYIYNEVTVADKELNFSGHADMIWDFSNFDPEKYKDVQKSFNIDLLPSNPIVVDMKTCNDSKYKSLLKQGPSLPYRVQITIYANILPVDYGLLIYENKNDSSTASYKITKNPDIYDIIRKQAIAMNEMVEHKLLPPPRPESKDTYSCRYCEFSKLCHSSKIWTDPLLNEKRIKFYDKLL